LGLLIALEGIDGVGKTTQLSALRDALEAAGLDVVTSREPTLGPHGQRLRQSMREGRLGPDEELALFMADRREHVASLIAPSLAAGKVVLLDRYYFSTAAYQGARGWDPRGLIADNEAFAPRPDLVVVLDADLADSLGRIEHEHDTFEIADALLKSRKIFLELARELDYVAVVAANQPPEVVSVEIQRLVAPLAFERFGVSL
jgi:dTMP kinase